MAYDPGLLLIEKKITRGINENEAMAFMPGELQTLRRAMDSLREGVRQEALAIARGPVKEYPILYSGQMVREKLAGRKTQTRRVIVPQPPAGERWEPIPLPDGGYFQWQRVGIQHLQLEIWGDKFKCPYGMKGDRLWTRETFRAVTRKGKTEYFYRADEEHYDVTWTPSIHMPRAASRILEEVINRRIERVASITIADIYAEGVCGDPPKTWLHADNSRELFTALWNHINGERAEGAYTFAKNPWVWVVESKVIRNA